MFGVEKMKLTAHFDNNEFTCKCGCGLNNISRLLVEKLERVRKACGVKFVITSGCRCAKHNAAVGGVANSSHVKGYAADIALTDYNRVIIIQALRKEFNRIGIAKNFVHVDVDPDLSIAEWRY
ncbi:MAG: peptidase M15 [Campylobacteraceae bacterium]|jgi:uncharacterized protein YcbK (DUF882 family)|nr:peptidase M15 [Campylobacteraceae bacterium]